MAAKEKPSIWGVIDQDNKQLGTVEPSYIPTTLPQQSVEAKPEKLIQKAVYIRPDQDKKLRGQVKQFNYEHDADINASHLVRFLLDRYGGDRLLDEFFSDQEVKGK